MFMDKERSEQRGTLLVEALAMLGLIAMVTPTLYKKSAERLQEIQDINIASQARTMNSVVETLMKAHVTDLLEATSSASNATIIISYDDASTRTAAEATKCGGNCFTKGYSSFVPFGFNVGDIKNYQAPTVYVHNDHSSLTSYIVYPKEANIGRKRAAKVASLVGANGGMVWTESSHIQGTGDAWSLDADMIHDLDIDTSELTQDSLVVTSVEPVSINSEDSEKFLYRVPPDDGNADAYYHNMMVTDLYMGGLQNPDDTYAAQALQFHSIYNVRKLTFNTRCKRSNIANDSSIGDCDPSIADLYVGKPIGNYMEVDNHSRGSGVNNGAAWIYGNLSALNDRFMLWNSQYSSSGSSLDRTGYDVMEFVRRTGESSDVDLVVFRAENGENGGSASVGMLDNFVLVNESSAAAYEFLVGNSSTTGGGAEGAFIHAFVENGDNTLYLNGSETTSGNSSVTYINMHGGYVNINGGSSNAETVINEAGGSLTAGKDADWIKADSEGNSAHVYILSGNNLGSAGGSDERVFAVGNIDSAQNHMIYGDSSEVSLRGGQVQVFSNTGISADNNVGGLDLFSSAVIPAADGGVLVNTKYTDILGSTFMTNEGQYQMSSTIGGEAYTRQKYTLGIAGSAWVDDTLLAREAWFDNAGMQDLHAGFSSLAAFRTNPDRAWLNVYGDDTHGGVYIRDPRKSTSSATDASSAVFWADSSSVHFKDFNGAMGYVQDGQAVLGWQNNTSGTLDNYFVAGSSRAQVTGSSEVLISSTDSSHAGFVDIQDGGFVLKGRPATGGGSLGNRIEAQAQEFAIWTKDKGGADDSSAQFLANETDIRTRYVNFTVEKATDSSAVFKVMPDLTDAAHSSDANVLVDGTLHVNGNNVIHIAGNAAQRADSSSHTDEDRAVFEVDPDYIQVLGKNGNDFNLGQTGTENKAIFRVGATDILGGSSVVTDVDGSSVYIRRGAIELEKSNSSAVGQVAADAGFGYIKANRLVSNTGIKINAVSPRSDGSSTIYERNEQYDQFMVNPAYTSVMHDIKLTTRGGARLSDVLPDYVLKGVYNLLNNCDEATTSGTCSGTGTTSWASPYIGHIPFAICPPGYDNLATVVPISFNVGQAGDVVLRSGRYVVNPVSRQADILRAAAGSEVLYPGFEEVSSINVNALVHDESSHTGPWASANNFRTEGWFMGFDATHDTADWSTTTSEMPAFSSASGLPYWKYKKSTGDSLQVVASPLYFQQNTWLKTSISASNDNKGWNAYMGFLYDTSVWGTSLGGTTSSDAPVTSNYNPSGGGNPNPALVGGDYVWNLFPVPTSTIEGHATVYCYFNRSNFSSWTDNGGAGGANRVLVDPYDQLNSYQSSRASEYGKHNDPTLRYDDPW